MGRKKILIEKRSVAHQVVTYNKRKDGIAKKAKELAIMCDTDVLLITFSPKGKYNLTLGPNSDFGKILDRYKGVNPTEREKRKKDSVQTLVKAFKKKNHIIDEEELLNHGEPNTPLAKMRATIADMTKEIKAREERLGTLGLIDNINAVKDINVLDNMESLLTTLLNEAQMKKKLHELNTGNPAFPPQEVMNQLAPSHFHQNSGASAMPSFSFHANDMLNMGMADTSVPGDGFSVDFMMNYNEGMLAQEEGSYALAPYLNDVMPLFP